MIDWIRVRDLKQDVGDEDFEEIIEIFLEEVAESLETLANATDPTKLGEDLHYLKGSTLNLGFQDLSELCAKGEALAANNESERFSLSELLQVFEASRTAFLQGLPEMRDP